VRAARAAATEWQGRGLVLLVDDDPRVRDVTGLLLRSMGFDVLSCADGEEALAEFDARGHEIRAVLLDVTMPDLDGDQVLHALRQRRSDVPVILCSGYSEHEIRCRFGPEERASFLQKPYPFEVLRARLRELLEPRA
jgi:DNA-binding response OmpR family regulator